ncbi:glycosyltransferase family 2 protein [Sphingomonas sp. I4]
MTRNAIEIAAVLIVRNEERCIARCLNSVAPWVDRMVVLDTGSTDDTVGIARELGAEVHHLPWPDSFAEARNQALQLADADWNLVIDADEWIIAGGESLRAWCESATGLLGCPCIHNETETGAIQRSWITRLVPRGVHYEGRVREQFVSPCPASESRSISGMTATLPPAGAQEGSLPSAPARRSRRPAGRRVSALSGRQGCADAGRSSVRLRLLCAGAGREPAGRELAARSGHQRAAYVRPCRASADGADGCGKRNAALAEIARFLFRDGRPVPESRHGRAATCARPLAAAGRGAWERCLVIGERPDLEGSVPGRGSHLARHNLEVLRSQLATLAA